MKRFTCMIWILALLLLFAACGQTSTTPSETEAPSALKVTEVPTVLEVTEATESEYGLFQEIVDVYGFPFYFKYTEGMSITTIHFYEDYAERKWRHSMEDTVLHENLTWAFDGETLVLSGGWNEKFTVNMDAGTATSLTDGKEYHIVVYDENGDECPYVQYGILQEVVDAYGFPFYFCNTEGMEKTDIHIFEDHAECAWRTNNDGEIYDRLGWDINGNELVIYGEWNEQLAVDMETGIATSKNDGKEYRLTVYDENGDGR